jgi:tetratricopeptide (TPR) repeat protein
MKHLLLIAALSAVPLTASAGPSAKEKKAAKKHIKAATEAHQKEQFDVALTELQAAYALDPQPDLLYAIGQVQVKLGNCPEAIMSYEQFLETKPAPDVADAANEAIKVCRDQLAAQPPPPPPPDANPQPVAPPPAPPPAPASEGKAFYRDVVGDVLVVGGAVALVTGVSLYVSARGTIDDAENAPTYAEQQSLVDDAHSKRMYAVIAGSVGAVAIGVGVWRFTRSGGGSGGNGGAEKTSVAVVPTTTGGLVTFAGRF